MGELRKRGRIWWYRYYRDGRRYEESARTDKYEVARDLLRTIEGDMAKGAPVSPKIGRLRFEDAATVVENEYTSNGRRSLGDLKRRIELHLMPHFRGRRMASITNDDVLAYTRKRLDAGAAPATINRELAIVKRMFTLAVKAKTLLVRPHIPMLKEDNVRTGFFEKVEFEAVRAELPSALRPVITFAFLTGWRVQSEILRLQWRNVDLKAGTVRLDVGTTKNRDGRLFPYGDRLLELKRLLEDQRRVTTKIEKSRGASFAGSSIGMAGRS